MFTQEMFDQLKERIELLEKRKFIDGWQDALGHLAGKISYSLPRTTVFKIEGGLTQKIYKDKQYFFHMTLENLSPFPMEYVRATVRAPSAHIRFYEDHNLNRLVRQQSRTNKLTVDAGDLDINERSRSLFYYFRGERNMYVRNIMFQVRFHALILPEGTSDWYTAYIYTPE